MLRKCAIFSQISTANAPKDSIYEKQILFLFLKKQQKKVIALAQTYFAIQTRRQEFHNFGYKGLYNGETADDIAKRKDLRYREEIYIGKQLEKQLKKRDGTMPEDLPTHEKKFKAIRK